jgi:hypothetical protein
MPNPDCPYAFVPVDPRAMLSCLPIYHDGNNREQKALFSGELHCRLDVLTPLLVGNRQYLAAKVAARRSGAVRLPSEWGGYAIGPQILEDSKKSASKHLLEPLRHSGREGQPVLIPFSSIKGPLRHSLAALFSSALERVDDKECEIRGEAGKPLYYLYSRYADTDRLPKPRRAQEGSLRDVFKQPDAQGTLSGIRALMGYSQDKDSLAGRIGGNLAAEVIRKGGERFVREDTNAVVPLRIQMGPNLVEYYFAEDRALKGRKFFLHQPDAASDHALFMEEDKATISEKLGSIARYVSMPGTQFRFSLFFRDLRGWELGALFCALEPQRAFFEDASRQLLPESIREYLAESSLGTESGQGPTLALKLGRGRPLGMGSVQISVQGGSIFDGGGEPLCSGVDAGVQKKLQAIRAGRVGDFFKHMFTETIDDVRDERSRILRAWLEVHRYRGRTRASYDGCRG